MNVNKVLELAKEWEVIWKERPFDNNNGLGCPGAFSLFYFLREMNPKPELVFEIGTWRGFSTWVIRQALPGVRIICSDPILASRQFLDQSIFQPEYRLSDVEYTWQDFSNIDIEITGTDRDKVVVFFDDHQNKLPRVTQAASKGIKHLIFDDNVPYVYTHDSFECMFLQYPELKDKMLSKFERYCVFPLFFKSRSLKTKDVDFMFEDDYRDFMPTIHETNEQYTWITKIELPD